MPPSNWQPRNRAVLFRQTDIGAFAVTIRIRAQGDVDPLRGIHHVEMSRPAEAAGTNGSVTALEAAAAVHIEFINHDTTTNIGNPNVQDECRLASPKRAAKEPGIRMAAVNEGKISGNKPAGAWRLAVFQNSGRRDFFQLLLQIVCKLHRSKRF